MKRSIYLGLLFLIISGLSACTSYDYYTAGLNKTNMSGYRTFAWMPMGNTKANGVVTANSIADANIKDAATMALANKGLKLQTQKPDLLISYTTTVGRGTRTNYYTNYGWGGGWGGYYGGWGWGGYGGWGWGGYYRPYYYAYGAPFAYTGGLTYAEQEHYKEGTLIIDLIDRRTRKVVWRGFGVGEVHSDPKKNIDDLPKVVDGILKQLIVTPPAGANYMYHTMSS